MRQFMIRACFVMLLLLALLGSSTRALSITTPVTNDDTPIQLVGQLGGSTLTAAVRAPYVYAGIGQRLAVFDISNPGAMPILGQSDLLPGVVFDLALQGDFVYVADRNGGLQIIDISQPTQPRVAGAFRMAGDVTSVAVAPPYAYILNKQLGLRVIDISDPTHPQSVAAYTDLNQPGQLKIAGDRLYVTTDADSVAVFDLSQPPSLTLLARFPLPFLYINDLEVTDNTLYVVGIDDLAYNYLVIYDISDLQAPQKLWSAPQAGGDIEVQGTTIFVAAEKAGIYVIDASAPQQPVILSHFAPGQLIARQIHLQGTLAAIAGGSEGVALADFSDLQQPSVLSAFKTVGESREVDMAGTTAYVVTSSNTLEAVDLSQPENPQLIASYQQETNGIRELLIRPPYAYLSTLRRGLVVLDISDPADVNEIGSYPLPTPFALDVEGSIGYAVSLVGLYILDLSDPAAIVLLAGPIPDVIGSQIRVRYPFAFVITRSELTIYDLSSWQQIVLLTSFNLSGEIAGMAFYQNMLYVAHGDSIAVIDIGDPYHSRLVSTIDLPGYVMAMKSRDSYLFVRSAGFYGDPFGTGGLRVFDITSPQIPVQIAHLTEIPGLVDFAFPEEGDYTAAAASSGGIAVFKADRSVPLYGTWLPRLRRQ